MKRNPEIALELKELGVELPEATSPYQLPEGYFEQFETELKEVRAVNQILESLPKEMPYSLSSDYFEHFQEELQGALFLDKLPKQVPFEVPTGYFEQFEKSIPAQSAVTKPEMQPLRKVSPVFSFLSMAASILLFLSIGFWMMRSNNKPSVEQQLATISNTEIQAYIAAHQNEFGNELSFENVDETQIDLPSLEQEVFNNYNLNDISSEELNKFVF